MLADLAGYKLPGTCGNLQCGGGPAVSAQRAIPRYHHSNDESHESESACHHGSHCFQVSQCSKQNQRDASIQKRQSGPAGMILQRATFHGLQLRCQNLMLVCCV